MEQMQGAQSRPEHNLVWSTISFVDWPSIACLGWGPKRRSTAEVDTKLIARHSILKLACTRGLWKDATVNTVWPIAWIQSSEKARTRSIIALQIDSEGKILHSDKPTGHPRRCPARTRNVRIPTDRRDCCAFLEYRWQDLLGLIR